MRSTGTGKQPEHLGQTSGALGIVGNVEDHFYRSRDELAAARQDNIPQAVADRCFADRQSFLQQFQCQLLVDRIILNQQDLCIP